MYLRIMRSSRPLRWEAEMEGEGRGDERREGTLVCGVQESKPTRDTQERRRAVWGVRGVPKATL